MSSIGARTPRTLRACVCLGLWSWSWSGPVAAAPAPEAGPAVEEPAPDTSAPTPELTPSDDAGEPEAIVEPEPEPEPIVEPEPEPEPEPIVEPEPTLEGPALATEAVDTDPGPNPDEPDERIETILPPRFDGPYIGMLAIGTANFTSVMNVETPAPLFGAGGFIQAGDAVFPWMSIGIAAGGQAAWVRDQQMFEGALLVEFGFVPIKRYPLSIRTGFGFGGGAVTQAGVDQRGGYGGALFKGSVRYEFFPLAATKRPDRGGGWALGPELGWLGATPAGKGQPFVNTILIGLSTSFYFGS